MTSIPELLMQANQHITILYLLLILGLAFILVISTLLVTLGPRPIDIDMKTPKYKINERDSMKIECSIVLIFISLLVIMPCIAYQWIRYNEYKTKAEQLQATEQLKRVQN